MVWFLFAEQKRLAKGDEQDGWIVHTQVHDPLAQRILFLLSMVIGRRFEHKTVRKVNDG